MPLGPRRSRRHRPAGSRPSRPSRVLAAGLVGLVLAVAAAVLPSLPSASAAEPTALALSAPAQYADRETTVTVTLTSGGAPLAGAAVTLERWDGAAWQPVAGGALVTDAAGEATAVLTVARTPALNDVRARFAGDAGHEPSTREYRLPLRKLATRTTIIGATSVVDEQSMYIRLVWRTADGEPIVGKVVLQRYLDGRWRTVRTYGTNEEGYVRVLLRPRVDSRYRAVGYGNAWAARSVSPTHRIDNRPPGVPVSLPGAAPRPRVSLPAQPRATTPGPDARISRIPDGVWRSMVGRSWHRGCPVGRSSLRLLRINYWDFHGYRRRGEVVAAASVVRQMAGALADMYRAKLPIRSMYRVDRFGWSRRLQGADDYRSMAADNTSAFNCRWVVGRAGVRSPHSYGRSLDVNPWENPYRSSHGWVPNAWWPSRSHSRVAWRSRTHRVVRIMAVNGLRWTYGRADAHHFDAVPRGGRPIVVPGCGSGVCH